MKECISVLFNPSYQRADPCAASQVRTGFTGSDDYYTGWSDGCYNEMVSEARATADPVFRITPLAACERLLLEAMPMMPKCRDVQPKLQQPYVRGLGSNLLHRERFKYAWIDTNWRPT